MLWKQSPKTKPPQFYKISLLNWLLFNSDVNQCCDWLYLVQRTLNDWLMQLSDYWCLITMSDYNLVY